MENCKPIMTPMGAASTLDLDEDGEPISQKEYRSMIRSLYLTARHSIISVSMCSFSSFLTLHICKLSKKMFRYLHVPQNFGIWISTPRVLALRSSSDADFGDSRTDRKKYFWLVSLFG